MIRRYIIVKQVAALLVTPTKLQLDSCYQYQHFVTLSVRVGLSEKGGWGSNLVLFAQLLDDNYACSKLL